MRKIWLLLTGLLLCMQLPAANLPYDEKADARADLGRALAAARSTGKNVLVVFGANWCPDCRRLDPMIHDTGGRLGGDRYMIVKVDVGNFDRNLDLARSFGNPIRKGIPAAVILTADSKPLYAGPLSHLVEPYRRWMRLAAYATAALAALFTAGAVVALALRKARRA